MGDSQVVAVRHDVVTTVAAPTMFLVFGIATAWLFPVVLAIGFVLVLWPLVPWCVVIRRDGLILKFLPGGIVSRWVPKEDVEIWQTPFRVMFKRRSGQRFILWRFAFFSPEPWRVLWYFPRTVADLERAGYIVGEN